jgi:hypothetical protein
LRQLTAQTFTNVKRLPPSGFVLVGNSSIIQTDSWIMQGNGRFAPSTPVSAGCTTNIAWRRGCVMSD